MFTLEQFNEGGELENRTLSLYRSSGPTIDLEAQKRATAKMFSSLRGVPMKARGIVYALFRGQPHNKRGHLLGQFPEVAIACAEEKAPLADVFAPVDQFKSDLKRDFYSRVLPSLLDAEQLEADAECRLRKAELRFEQSPNDLAVEEELREAVRGEEYAVELMRDVLDADVELMQSAVGC